MSGKFKTKKRLGQNFLRSKTLIEEIVAGSGISENDLVIGLSLAFFTKPSRSP